jgi:hypothetical protein
MGTGTVETEELISTLRTAAGAIRSVTTSPLDEIKAIHAARNALEAREADLLAVMDETKAHEADGAASVSTWAARELLQDAKTTKQMIRSAHTMAELPLFAAAHHAGVICGEHVNALTYGLKHVGHGDTIDLEEDLLTVATQKTPVRCSSCCAPAQRSNTPTSSTSPGCGGWTSKTSSAHRSVTGSTSRDSCPSTSARNSKRS